MTATITSDFTSIYKHISEFTLTDKELTCAQAAKCVDRSSWVRKEVIRLVIWLRGKGWINEKKILEIIAESGKSIGENVGKMKNYSQHISEVMSGAHYITPKPTLADGEMSALKKIANLVSLFKTIPKEGQEPASQFFKELKEISEQADQIFKTLNESLAPKTKEKEVNPQTEQTNVSSKEEPVEPIKPKGNPLIEKFSDQSKELLTKFLVPLADILKDPVSATVEEFKAIETLSENELTKENGYSCDLNRTPEKISKNRYSNAIPLEHNCFGTMEDGSDYINASRIKIGERLYIAAQAPISEIPDEQAGTVGDFFNMIHEQDARVVVSLVMHMERKGDDNIEKCAMYWSPHQFPFTLKDGSTMVLSGEVEIANANDGSKLPEKIVERTFTISKDNVSKKVVQLHYQRWPDMGVPNVELFLKLLEHLRKLEKDQPKDCPVVCHCSAGLGRTGVFIGADSLSAEIAAKRAEGKGVEHILVNFTERVLDMRTQRLGMVCTEGQLQAIKNIAVKFVSLSDKTLKADIATS